MVQRGVADDFDCISAGEMKRHPYYQDFLKPVGLQYFGGVRMAAGDDVWCVSVQRSAQQGPFTSEEKRKLASLAQKLGTAAAVARALGFATANAAVEALELSGLAVALLNRKGEVLRLNRKAEALLGPELNVVEKRIVSQDKTATTQLDRALHSLLWAETSAALMQPVSLPRRGCRAVLAYPIKLTTVSASIFADCQALLVFIDLESRPRPPQEALHISFDLTPAEAQLAIRICSGEALETSADKLGVSKETVRNQLKSIFYKTGVHSQSQLVGLLASFLHSGKDGS